MSRMEGDFILHRIRQDEAKVDLVSRDDRHLRTENFRTYTNDKASDV